MEKYSLSSGTAKDRPGVTRYIIELLGWLELKSMLLMYMVLVLTRGFIIA
jgi:hypothetical protein